MNICGAKRLGHFCRSQFYVALKLISLAQNSYEISLENLNKPNLPLPKRISQPSFNQQTSLDKLDKIDKIEKFDKFDKFDKLKINNIQDISSSNTNLNSPGILLPPPTSASKSNRNKHKLLSPSSLQLCKFCSKNLIASTTDQEQFKNLKSFVLICPNCKNTNQSQEALDSSPNEFHSSSSEFNSELGRNEKSKRSEFKFKNYQEQSSSSSDNSRCSSTELYETMENSGQAFEKLKPWEKLESNQAGDVGGEIDESKHFLLNDLNNDEDENINEATVNNKICLNVNQYDSSNFYQHSRKLDKTEDETDEDVFVMSDDQIKYYHEKFCQLLTNKQDKLLAGSNVKAFFEKSKLNLNDLKQIWNLSDLDNDGNLSIDEFCIAMHLIVLKRNKVPLPSKLPHSLSADKINQLLLDNYLIDYLINKTPSSSLTNYQHVSTINVTSNSLVKPQLKNSFENNYINASSSNTIHDISDAKNNTLNLRNHDTNNTNELKSSLPSSPNDFYSPNREWTKFNNSPLTTNLTNLTSRHQNSNQLSNLSNPPNNQNLNKQPNQQNNNQINLQSNDVKFNLMTPANFDRIELDPTLIHPLPLKVASINQINLPNVNKDRIFKNSSNLNR